VQLDSYSARWPHELSGGQLQRVAIARSLVIEPEVLLLDEPLSNLDARLRVEMRAEIRQLQKSLGITALYVTHDQEEALAISDRIAVMRGGRIEQVGSPDEIYRRPATPFVAEFVGTTNLLSGPVTRRDGRLLEVAIAGQTFRLEGAAAGGQVSFSLRPEAIRLLPPNAPVPEGWPRLEGRLARVEFLGAMTRAEMVLTDGALLRLAATELPQGIAAGANVSVTYDPAQVTIFGAP
jgi:iron(III) transport system ATP-binding protein/putative spermidine/putrescine transport system ATP-binding protein